MSGIGVGKERNLSSFEGAATGGGSGVGGVADTLFMLLVGAGALVEKFADFWFLCQSLTPLSKGWGKLCHVVGTEAYVY
ncbi:MAG: hypothetical protein BA870_03390 [Desulfuromonadales bacterium C00003094]|jgi:hypothetical protein|nr:MAG: hypothetical protein BA870_03390 [Desulfuromonadales bacterium C00003094]OEU76635.1 MAG: hypothetical protein BA869_03460 [Desulfuromonadales bacterium C00003107]